MDGSCLKMLSGAFIFIFKIYLKEKNNKTGYTELGNTSIFKTILCHRKFQQSVF